MESFKQGKSDLGTVAGQEVAVWSQISHCKLVNDFFSVCMIEFVMFKVLKYYQTLCCIVFGFCSFRAGLELFSGVIAQSRVPNLSSQALAPALLSPSWSIDYSFKLEESPNLTFQNIRFSEEKKYLGSEEKQQTVIFL